MSRTSWLARSLARRPRRKAASPLRVDVLEDRNLLSFSSIPSYAAGSSSNAVALGDFNNDTRLDLAVANHGDGTVSVLLGKAVDSFGPTVNTSTGTGLVSLQLLPGVRFPEVIGFQKDTIQHTFIVPAESRQPLSSLEERRISCSG